MIKPNPKQDFYTLSEEINSFFKENKIFEKSINSKPADRRYVFIDGPPFVTGMPHYGSLLSSVAKDVVTRYWATKGYRVRRVWGWDCHGLPIEEQVSKKFGLKSKKDIENFGISQYVKECRNHIQDITAQWRWYIDAVGRWVDMDNAYFTMNPEFNETVLWVFKQAWEKGLVYKSKRVSLFSTDTATPVSEFEVAESNNYQDVDDLSVFVKFQLTDDSVEKLGLDKNSYVVAWTTTPWTIPSNFALALNPEATYVVAKEEETYLIIAKDRVDYTFQGKPLDIIRELKGVELEGLRYVPVYDFFVPQSNPNDFKIYMYDGVTTEDGTGVLHIAPGFGAEDFDLGNKYSLSGFQDIDDEGNFTVGPWVGKYLRVASVEITDDLEQKGNLLRKEIFRHRVPFFRGNNPLIYKAQEAYFINIEKIKDRMLELNQKINWVPSHFKDGRFADVIKSAPDWCISRTRYWATILPIWKASDGEELIIGSIEEMSLYNHSVTSKEVDGRKVWYYNDEKLMLHRDMCDEIVLTKDGKEFHRVSDVMDCWLDSGSVPIAEYHYPFENKDVFDQSFPADFIAEYVGQIRAWFNVLLRVSTIVFDDIPFKNVIATGNMSGTDGRKMSKSFKNYPDPKETIQKYGGDALRLYLAGSPIMIGNDISFNEQDLKIQVQEIILPLWNTFSFLATYAEIHNWKPSTGLVNSLNLSGETPEAKNTNELHPLNAWVLEKLRILAVEFEESMDSYNVPAAIKSLRETISEISKWYIRSSREQFNAGEQSFIETLFTVLVQVSRIASSVTPFISEKIYLNLLDDILDKPESVHLTAYPSMKSIDSNQEIIEQMSLVREIAAIGNELRAESQIKSRQPLSSLTINTPDNIHPWMIEILKKELNVKSIDINTTQEYSSALSKDSSKSNFKCILDTFITPELQEEGELREIIRQIQADRKKQGMRQGENITVNATVAVYLKNTFEKFQNEIQRTTNVSIQAVEFGENIDIIEIKILK